MPNTRYPPANTTAQWYANTHPGDTWTSLEKAIVHSTESPGWPGYSGGAIAPNLTVAADFRAKTLRWRQHYPVNMSSRAMQNTPGGVQTNRDRAVQIEIVGTCDIRPTRTAVASTWMRAGLVPNVDFLILCDPPDWVITQFAQFAAWLHTEWAVPLTTVPTWLPFDASYGANNGVRLTGATWDAYRGWAGHMHAAENQHGDPGHWPMHRVLNTARTQLNPPEDDMPYTPQQLQAIVAGTPLTGGGTLGELPGVIHNMTLGRSGTTLAAALADAADETEITGPLAAVLNRLAAIEAKVDALTPPPQAKT